MVSRRLQAHRQTVLIGILSGEGLRALRRSGHAAVAGACAPDLPAGSVRFVDASRRAALENAAEEELAAMYAAPFPERPFIKAVRAGEGRSSMIDISVPPDLASLRGHFPALPDVPGAIQLGWALELGAEALGTPRAMRAIRSVKFERIIQPGHALRLSLTADCDAATLRFEFASASGTHSTGRIETWAGDG